MIHRTTRYLALVIIASAGLTACLGPSQDEIDALATGVAEIETATAGANDLPTEPPPEPTPTLIPPTATPSVLTTTFTDPSGDVQHCQTGAPIEGDFPHVDISELSFVTDETGLAFDAEFPQTEELTDEFTIPGSFLGILMLDNAEQPQEPDASVGTYGLGLLRIDALWNGQTLDKRVFVRDEAGGYVQEENMVEVAASGNHLRIKLLPSRLVRGINRAGFAVLSIDSCDLAGVEFDYSSGSPADGMLTIDIDADLDF